MYINKYFLWIHKKYKKQNNNVKNLLIYKNMNRKDLNLKCLKKNYSNICKCNKKIKRKSHNNTKIIKNNKKEIKNMMIKLKIYIYHHINDLLNKSFPRNF